jgi:hypothetical protein
MNRKQVVAELIGVAEEFEQYGRIAESVAVTNLAKRVAQYKFEDEDPDYLAADQGFMGSDGYDDQQGQGGPWDDARADMQGMDVGAVDPQKRAEEILQKPNPTPEELREYYDIVKGGGAGPEPLASDPKAAEFASHLHGGGAEVDFGPFGNQ